MAAGVASHSCTAPACASGPCMPACTTVPWPHVDSQLAGMAPVLWGVQESQDGSWERLSLQRIHCGTGELCSGRGLRNATEDSLIRVSSSALGQRLRSAPADLDPRRRFASVHSASDSTSPSRRIAAAELFTHAQTRHWAPLQSIRLGWRLISDGRYGCLRNRLRTRRLQAQDRWSVSQPAKGV